MKTFVVPTSVLLIDSLEGTAIIIATYNNIDRKSIIVKNCVTV